MKHFLVLFATVAVVTAIAVSDSMRAEWEAFKIEHNKKYDNEIEDNSRMEIFIANQQMIAEHNLRYEQGLVTFSLKMNQFGDMSQEELRARNGYKQPQNVSGNFFIPPANVPASPSQVDWRQNGAVTQVKNQAQCGSCWAFSATGSLEGQHFLKTGVLVSLSEQNLVDCSKDNFGCDGGLMDRAFEYIKNNKGIDTESSYPYEAKVGVCRYNPQNKGADCSGYVNIPKGDEKSLMQAVANVGPVSVAVHVTDKFYFYKSGVFYDSSCDSLSLNHAVLVVGYGTDPSDGDYWLVKNSWGSSYGEQGYIRIARNRNNHCGIASGALYPLV